MTNNSDLHPNPLSTNFTKLLNEELTTSMQDLSTGFPQTQPLYTNISKIEFHRSKVHSSMICKVFDITSFFCSYDHPELSRSYLARHWRNGQNSMISQALHSRKTELKIHVLPHCKDLHSSLYSSPDRTLALFSTRSLLTTIPKNCLPPSLINAAPHSLHQSRRHLPAIPSQTTR